MNGLMQLRAYNSSDSDSDGDEEDRKETERKAERLPMPEVFSQTKLEKVVSREQNQDGKIRNFPHEPGIWTTYVYLPVSPFPEFKEFLEKLQLYLEPFKLKLVDDFHISLSKTVILKHHWIQGFIEIVHRSLDNVEGFSMFLQGLKVYVNEHQTRTFVSLRVAEGIEQLTSIVKQVDACLCEYNLEPFYSDPSFHLSLLWCSGDRSGEINSAIDKLPEKLKNFNFSMNFSHCECTSGNKHFRFNFR